MKQVLIDTNLLIRLVVGEPEKQFKETQALFEKAEHGKFQLVLASLILAEAVYVLESVYQHARGDIADALSQVVTLPCLRAIEEAVLIDALTRYKKTKIDFADCYLAALAVEASASVASFDGDFQKFKDLDAKQPKQF